MEEKIMPHLYQWLLRFFLFINFFYSLTIFFIKKHQKCMNTIHFYRSGEERKIGLKFKMLFSSNLKI